MAAILDPFSEACFAPECNLIPMLSTDYLSRLRKSGHIDFVLVESVWRGPGNSWSHYLVNNKKNPIPKGMAQLVKLVKECKQRRIPTVFWAKEDPVHFKHFVIAASLFDYVATTSIECVKEYSKKFKHNRVFALPFAAQPDLHSPVGLLHRKQAVCFAGACRNTQYPNRCKAMENVLAPAIPFGLHIYDRAQVGSNGEPFPAVYKNAVLGGVSYDKMLEKYREYKVFLNVNSVDNSATMFSRRVFELLACGTPVISSPSIGIQRMLPEVLLSSKPAITKQCLSKLLSDPTYWTSVSIAGARRVLADHTYAHRIRTICDNLHISVDSYTLDRISKARALGESYCG